MAAFKIVDYTKMDGGELLKCKRSLIREINKTEKRKLEDMEVCLMFRSWVEDEEILYEHNLNELKKIIDEILRRMQSHEWMFAEEEW